MEYLNIKNTKIMKAYKDACICVYMNAWMCNVWRHVSVCIIHVCNVWMHVSVYVSYIYTRAHIHTYIYICMDMYGKVPYQLGKRFATMKTQ